MYGYVIQREGQDEYTVWLTSPHTGSKLEVLGWFGSQEKAQAFIDKEQEEDTAEDRRSKLRVE